MLSFLTIDRATEMRLRLKKVQRERINARALKVLNRDRVRRYEESLSIEEFISDLLKDCVDAACSVAAEPKRTPLKLVNLKPEEKPKVESKVTRKRRNRYDTWHARGYAIYMLLHPGIFNGDAYRASQSLGIARTTLLG